MGSASAPMLGSLLEPILVKKFEAISQEASGAGTRSFRRRFFSATFYFDDAFARDLTVGLAQKRRPDACRRELKLPAAGFTSAQYRDGRAYW